MTPVLLANGEALRLPLRDKSVHCIMTSPPYYALRAYHGNQGRQWPSGDYAPMPGLPPLSIPEWYGPLGNEPTPEMYVFHLVLVFREAHRVLRDDGVAWLNLADSFSSEGGDRTYGSYDGNTGRAGQPGNRINSITAGNLIGIPERVMFALQADGWIVRQNYRWVKVNPLPESVKGWRYERPSCQCVRPNLDLGAGQKYGSFDGKREHLGNMEDTPATTADASCPRCHGTGKVGEPQLRRGSWRHTSAVEHVYMLTKQMAYYADSEAARERPAGYKRKGGNKPVKANGVGTNGHGTDSFHQMAENGRNPRNFALLTSEPYPGSHFATYPTELIRPLIAATCPAKCCPHCGMGWSPSTESHTDNKLFSDKAKNGMNGSLRNDGSVARTGDTRTVVLGYRQSCDCPEHTPVPGVVLDPFNGSGTSCLVARQLGRMAIGVDLSMEYLQQAKVRVSGRAPQYPKKQRKTADNQLSLFATAD